MGTLFNQPVREMYLVNNAEREELYTDWEEKWSKKMTFSEFIEMEKALQLGRRNFLIKDDGDIFDEQMGGFGEILRDIKDALEKFVYTEE